MKTTFTITMFFLLTICYTFAQDSTHLNYIIPDFQVNENSGVYSSTQTHPSIDSDSSGNFVIAWYDERDQKTSIYAQHYNSNGEPIGPNIKVNEINLVGNSTWIAVYTDKSENYLIVWYNDNHIYLQKFSNTFAKIGNNIIFNKEKISGVFFSTSMDETGNFVIIWTYYQDIFTQRYSSNGNALTSKIKVNDEKIGAFVYQPSVSSDQEGNFVVAWYVSGGLWGSNNYSIYAKRFSNDGDVLGEKIKVNNDCTGKSGGPSISADTYGNFTIVWGNHCQRYTKEGERIGDNFIFAELNTGASNMYSYVTASDSGDFVVTWLQFDNSLYNIYARCYSSSGTASGLPFKVNTDFSLYHSNPAVAINNNRSFVIAWDTEDEFSDNVYAQRYDMDGKNEGDNFRVNDNKESASYNSSIAVDDNGNFVITWLDNRKTYEGNLHDIFFQRYSNNGTALGDNIKLNRKINEDNEPSIATDSAGNFVITWVENNRIYAQRFSNNGSAIDSAFKVYDTDNPSSYQSMPSITLNNNGNFVIVWHDRTRKNTIYYENIYAQRFSKESVKIGSYFKVNNIEGSFIGDPDVCIDRDGDFIITWSDEISNYPNHYKNIYAQRYADDGTPLGNNFKVNDIDIAYYINSVISIDCDKNGNFVIAWYGDEDIFAHRYLNDGTAIGNNFKVNDSKIKDAYEHSISVSMDEIGNYIISWVSDGEYSSLTVSAQRYLNDNNPIGNNFILSSNGSSPDVKLWNGRIYTTWTAADENGMGENVYANLIDWNIPTSVAERGTSGIPTEFTLCQNYPNPFNPTTTIKYSIPVVETHRDASLQRVTLKVYDILGREIAVLVNEEQKPGYYEVKWDASNQPSGVYFYRINAGDPSASSGQGYVETKKMILLR